MTPEQQARYDQLEVELYSSTFQVDYLNHKDDAFRQVLDLVAQQMAENAVKPAQQRAENKRLRNEMSELDNDLPF